MLATDVVEFTSNSTEFWIQKAGDDKYDIGVDDPEEGTWAHLTVTRSELYGIYVLLRDFLEGE